MKAYGIPRNVDVSSPDKLDLINYARASHVGHCPGKSGDCHNSYRNPKAKRNMRRVYKRIARNENKNRIIKSLNEE